ncbi:hypothetical protein NLM68_15725 [Escherichia coli]|uniref:hypothetical protein n=1 Tax=Escherichia coli TaxID=562 RepID=UPI0020B3BFF5|nr:hypothetical protein [Escherichia coli]MCP3499925.1 hypothetical protein [Escherichia coli]
MKFNHNLLFISSQYLDGDNPSQQVLEELQTELAERGFKIHITHQISDGLKIIEKSPQYSGIGFYWEPGNDSNLLIVFYVQIMPDDFVMQLHRF